MRRALAATLSVLLGAGVLSLAAPPSAQAGPTGALKGYVENDRQKPVAGAEIEVAVPGSKTPLKTVTDKDGNFSLTGVPVGDVTVRIRAKGCFPQDQHVVVAGKGVTSLAATLKLGVRYAGKVHDAKGAPIAGVRARAVVMRSEDVLVVSWDDLASAPPSSEPSGPDGAFVVDGLEAGKRYVLRFKHPHYAKTEVSSGLPSKPGTSKEGIDVTMADAAWVVGTVVDEAGKPVAKAQIYGDPDWPRPADGVWEEELGDQDGRRSEENRTDAKGAFVLGGLVDASVELTVMADGYHRLTLPLTALEVGKERALDPVKLETATAWVEGFVVDAKGRPVPDAWLRAEGDGGSRYGRADKGGRFRLAKVAAHGGMTLSVDAMDFLQTEMKDVASGTKGLKVVLLRAPRLKIKVTDTAGQLVRNVVIRVRTIANTPEEKRQRQYSDNYGDQPDEGYDVTFHHVGEVEAVLVAEGYETTKAGPWTAKAGETIKAGVVAMKRKEK
jgi:hypothetical protein